MCYISECTFNYSIICTDELSKQLSVVSKKLSAVITSAEIASNVASATKSILPANCPFIVVDDGTESSFLNSNVLRFNVG